MIAPVILAVVASIAGHPTTVACDADTNPSPFAAPGVAATAWTLFGGNVIHAHPRFCDDSNAPIGSDGFARAVDVFLHEAAHARGIRSESCAEMTADIGVYQVLRDFYNVPFFSATSQRVGAQVLALTRTQTANYQPEACWNAGAYR